MEEFAKKLKIARKNAGLTQRQMAKELGIPFDTYLNYESVTSRHREPDQKMLILIAKILNVTIDSLLHA